MKTKTMQVPAADAMLTVELAALGEVQQAESGGKTIRTRAFRGQASSGKPFLRQSWFGEPYMFAVDLDTLDVSQQRLNVLRDHWASDIVGFTEKVEITEDRRVMVEGTLFDATAAGAETLTLLEAGAPLQMSMYVPPGKVLKVAPGESTQVNGHELKAGPGGGFVFQDAVMREATITALGADRHTSAAVLSAGGTPAAETKIEWLTVPTVAPGADQDAPPAQETKMDLATLKAEHPDLYAEVLSAGEAAGIEKGTQQERERVAEIRKLSEGVEPERVERAINEGLSADDAARDFLAYMQASKEGRLAAVRSSTPEPSGNDDPDALAEGDDQVDEFDEAEPKGKNAAKKVAAMSEGDKKWTLQYQKFGDGESSAEQLQEEFGDVELYLAYKRHPLSRREARRAR